MCDFRIDHVEVSSVELWLWVYEAAFSMLLKQ